MSIFKWAVLLALVCSGSHAFADVNSMWQLWRQGEIRDASKEARRLLRSSPDQAHHMLMLTSFVRGKFLTSIRHQEQISYSYSRFGETLMPVIDAHKHLRQYAEAYAFAVKHSLKNPIGLQESLKKLADHPPVFDLTTTTEIPFKMSDPYNPYLPAFDMKLNGTALVGHLDTGGTFVVISKELADQLGLKYSYSGKGHCNNREASIWFAQADFQLGDLRASGVPTEVSDCLDGTPMKDRAIFGTSILQQFLSTIDYPASRMILSPFSHRAEHFKRVSTGYKTSENQRFHIWADHYMFTKGQMTGMKNLNFFVDTGLVYFHADGRQAAFLTSTQKLVDVGYDPQVLAKSEVVDVIGDLGLKNLTQSGHAVKHQDKITFASFGGVEITGLIAHAFLKNYSWTIDFERMSYAFRQRVQSPQTR